MPPLISRCLCLNLESEIIPSSDRFQDQSQHIYTAAVPVNNYLPGGRVNKKIFARQRGRVNKKLFARQKKLLARQSISMVAMTQIEVYG